MGRMIVSIAAFTDEIYVQVNTEWINKNVLDIRKRSLVASWRLQVYLKKGLDGTEEE